LAFAIGPVLIVSLGLKEHWGRVRPMETTLFAGQGEFTPYYLPTGTCETDCSFTSGHSSRGFFFMAVAIAAYGLGWRHRHAILAGAVAFGVLTATLRIVEGKHFLSDVTLSSFIVTYVAWVLFAMLYPRESRDT
jgi:lipid A 4'-phosphatase